jgi:hypothetical protein
VNGTAIAGVVTLRGREAPPLRYFIIRRFAGAVMVFVVEFCRMLT